MIRQRSTEPGVGILALGSNSFPDWCRLIFCWPKPKAFLSPWVTIKMANEITGRGGGEAYDKLAAAGALAVPDKLRI